MIIERTEQEYMQELIELYENNIKPLLLEGYSLTKAFNMNNISSGKSKRKAKELRKMALNDGYKLRRGMV